MYFSQHHLVICQLIQFLKKNKTQVLTKSTFRHYILGKISNCQRRMENRRDHLFHYKLHRKTDKSNNFSSKDFKTVLLNDGGGVQSRGQKVINHVSIISKFQIYSFKRKWTFPHVPYTHKKDKDHLMKNSLMIIIGLMNNSPLIISWNSKTLATSCEELTHWERP